MVTKRGQAQGLTSLMGAIPDPRQQTAVLGTPRGIPPASRAVTVAAACSTSPHPDLEPSPTHCLRLPRDPALAPCPRPGAPSQHATALDTQAPRTLTSQAFSEVSEAGLPQRPQDGQALGRPVLVGPQQLQVLRGARGGRSVGRPSVRPSVSLRHPAGGSEPWHLHRGARGPHQMNTAPAGSWLPEPGDPQKCHRLRVAEPPAPSTHPLGRRGHQNLSFLPHNVCAEPSRHSPLPARGGCTWSTGRGRSLGGQQDASTPRGASAAGGHGVGSCMR